MKPPRAYFRGKRRLPRSGTTAALSVFLFWLTAVAIAPMVAGLIYQIARG